MTMDDIVNSVDCKYCTWNKGSKSTTGYLICKKKDYTTDEKYCSICCERESKYKDNIEVQKMSKSEAVYIISGLPAYRVNDSSDLCQALHLAVETLVMDYTCGDCKHFISDGKVTSSGNHLGHCCKKLPLDNKSFTGTCNDKYKSRSPYTPRCKKLFELRDN